jgi:hypothetical protein
MPPAAKARCHSLLEFLPEQPVRETVGNHKGNIGMAGTIEKSLLVVALFGIVLPNAG